MVGGHQRGTDRLASGPGRGAAGLGCDDSAAGIRAMVAGPDAPVAISVSVDEVPLADLAVEAKALSDALLAPLDRSRLAP